MSKGETTRLKVEASLTRRRRKEFSFRLIGMLATAVGIVFLGVFFASLIAQGASAFQQTFIKLDIELSADVLAPDGELDLAYADFDGLVRSALRSEFPEVKSRGDRRSLYRIVSVGAAYQVRDLLVSQPELVGTVQTLWVPSSSDVDMLIKGNIDREIDEALRPVSDKQIGWATGKAFQPSIVYQRRLT